MSFIFIVVAIGYTILAVIGDLKNKMITEEDINNDEDKQKRTLYIISLIVYAIVMIFAIFLWGREYIEDYGGFSMIIKLAGIVTIAVLLGGIVGTRDKINTVIDNK